MNKLSQQIDAGIRKTADKSSQLSETVQELTVALAEQVQKEHGRLNSLGAMAVAGDAVARMVVVAPQMMAQAAQAKGVTINPNDISRESVDTFMRSQSNIDLLTDIVLRRVQRHLVESRQKVNS